MHSSAPPPLPRHVQQGSVAQTVRALPVGARPSEVWRGAALALLRLNPKEAEALATLFEEEGTRDETRLLVLDLLAGAGSFEVQVVMRRLLSLGVARRSNRTFATFVQRLGALERPDGPTLRFLMSVYAESRGEPEDVRAACAYALGAAAGHAYVCGDEDAAIRATEIVRRDLLAMATGPEKCALLLAIGNAGLTSDLPAILRAAQDPDGPVRAAAALALRRIDAHEARAQLLTMLGDHEHRVAESAVAALFDQQLDDGELESLAGLVLGGRTSLALDGRILRLLVAQRPGPGPASARTSAVENALRLLLGRVEAAVEATGTPERRFPATNYQSWTAASGGVDVVPATDRGAPVPEMPEVPEVPEPFPPSERAAIVTDARATIAIAPLVQVALRQEAAGERPAGHAAAVEAMRRRLAALGLDANARMSMLPLPPQRPLRSRED